MLTAIGSICAGVTLKAVAKSAAEVVPSGLVGKAWIKGLRLDPFGSIPFLPRTPWKLANQFPPRTHNGPLPLTPNTFCSKRAFGNFTALRKYSFELNASFRCFQ